MFLYYREDGTVCMRSKDKMKIPLQVLEINPNEEELQKINDNYVLRVENEQLVFKIPEHLEKEIKKRKIKKIKDDLLVANPSQLKDIIKDLLNEIYAD